MRLLSPQSRSRDTCSVRLIARAAFAKMAVSGVKLIPSRFQPAPGETPPAGRCIDSRASSKASSTPGSAAGPHHLRLASGGAGLLWLPDLRDARWFRTIPFTHRRALAVKNPRIYLFGAMHYRATPDAWTADERDALRSLTTAALAATPAAERVLSRAEHDPLDAAFDRAVSAERLVALSARRRHDRPDTLVPRDVRFPARPGVPAAASGRFGAQPVLSHRVDWRS